MNIVLNLTEHCNLQCSYCYYRENPAHQSMSAEILRQSIDFAWTRSQQLNQKHLNITFFGGEPLLEKSLIRQGVEYALATRPKNFALKFAINTNGTLFDQDILDFFKEHHFRIFLSLDGPQEVHDSQRPMKNGSGSFAHIEPWISQLTQLETLVIRVIHPRFLTDVASSIQWLHQQGFKQITTAIEFKPDSAHPWTDHAMDHLKDQYHQIGEYWLTLKRANQYWYFGTFNDKIRLKMENTCYKNTTCHIAIGGLAISAQGQIFPCTRFVNSHSQAPWRLGHVQSGLNPLIEQELIHYLKKDKTECEDCAIKDRCVGNGCACTAFYTTGNLYGILPVVCTHERMLCDLSDQLAFELLPG